MKARLFVVNEDTIETTLNDMEVSVIVPEPRGKKLWNKTLIDIVSDLLQVEIGDYIFLWESGYDRIYGVYRAISRAFYRKDEGNDIFKIKIDRAYLFEKPIREYDVINNPYMKNQLWNIIGKKVAGKARGTSPITPDEMEFLIQSLIDENHSNYEYVQEYAAIDVDNEVELDFVNECDGNMPKCLADYIYQPVRVKKHKEVKYEKALEGILNLLFRDKEQSIIDPLNINCNNVVWFANYLPYGLERSEIDYMIMESLDGAIICRINVIELMPSVIDIDHINRCLRYAKWVASSVTKGKNIVRPILICGNKSKTSKKGFDNEVIKKAILNLPQEYGFEKLDVYTYSILDTIKFEKYNEREVEDE